MDPIEEIMEPKKKKGELLYRCIVIAGLAANFWIRGNFVSAETYKADKAKTDETLARITTVLATDEERSRVNDRQDEQLKDHEMRIRKLERP